ncbi:MAG: xanthine dehydrogenase FAD-binding subunit XdhB [Desulfuromusa sp.]|nr:xanthine dehydrogenase FAD-binding subunit XdhB [Desulfuromusa sp.]
MFNIEKYSKVKSVSEAVSLLEKNPRARLIAGGTDVLIRLREGEEDYTELIDIHDLAELMDIQKRENGDISMGAGVTFSQVMENAIIKESIPVIAQAAGTIGGPQVRNVATIGGNICNGAISADSAAALFVLDAVLEIERVNGARELPVREFYLGPGRVALEHGDVLKAIIVKQENYAGYGANYYKYAMRNAMDIATIGCAATCKLDGEVIEELKIAFTVAAPKPMRAQTAEDGARGKRVTDENIEKIAALVMEDLNPRDSWRASKNFRLQVIRILAKRVITAAIEDAGVQR